MGEGFGGRGALVEPRHDVLEVRRSVATLARVTSSPTRSAINSRNSSSDFSGVKVTGVAAHSRSASRPLSVSE